MLNKIISYIRKQFGTSIEMLENVIDFCPLNVLNITDSFSEFWYLSYNTISWLEFYLTKSRERTVCRSPIFEPRKLNRNTTACNSKCGLLRFNH